MNVMQQLPRIGIRHLAVSILQTPFRDELINCRQNVQILSTRAQIKQALAMHGYNSCFVKFFPYPERVCVKFQPSYAREYFVQAPAIHYT